MANKKNIELKRVNLNLPIHLIERVNEYANNLGINNTSAYIVLLNQALDQKDTMSQMPTIISMFNEMKQIQSEMNEEGN